MLSTGGEISGNGIVFNNFQFIAGELDAPQNFPAVPPPVNQYPWPIMRFAQARAFSTLGEGHSILLSTTGLSLEHVTASQASTLPMTMLA